MASPEYYSLILQPLFFKLHHSIIFLLSKNFIRELSSSLLSNYLTVFGKTAYHLYLTPSQLGEVTIT